tara:strand:- start:827 stop:1393 length:567 start_codon:yes stop_codon:yes gene_type:complete
MNGLFPIPIWKLKVPNHESIKERYLASFISAYETGSHEIPDGWITHKCHTSFSNSELLDRDICDEYVSIFDTIFEKEWSGNFECWYQVYKNEEYQEWHDHLPSALSAIHFLNFNKEHKAPIFEDPSKGLKAIVKHSGLNEQLGAPFVYTPQVEEGDILIFPSYLKHTVPAGVYDSYRVTIALNLNVKL